ncbi:hypothetical protein RO3G_06938 [Lichtheimia corymbifera JMRC:FSU:9682]|uniref:CREG-like beta-barrel domain-containing protein n=1 Tax=Lichtheimia corymbifera JMRC:FSU:9682 TaxID=1263082 RepID=A0A068RL25_9FUNG|nr:hypothetical protein RO3G_06938 [Lichtheimia corymbifera JMRC:FSU:9682]
MLLLTLLLAFATVIFCSPLHSGQTVNEAAELARRVVKDAGIGTILTLVDESIQPNVGGHPFGIMEYYSGDWSDKGNLLLFMSDLQMSARNMQHEPSKVGFTIRALKEYDNPKMGNETTPVQSPRLTLLGEIAPIPPSQYDDAMDCFGEKHPEAKDWRSFHDFNFYELQVKEIYYVGGFGGLNYIGWIPLELYQGSGEAKKDTRFRLQY